MNVEILGQGLPEGGPLFDAPAVQGLVVVELQVVAQVDPAAEGIHPAGLDLRCGRAPEHIVHAESPLPEQNRLRAGSALWCEEADPAEKGGLPTLL
ncbi:hypothetical protein D9M73_277810 [compost metagenome]